MNQKQNDKVSLIFAETYLQLYYCSHNYTGILLPIDILKLEEKKALFEIVLGQIELILIYILLENYTQTEFFSCCYNLFSQLLFEAAYKFYNRNFPITKNNIKSLYRYSIILELLVSEVHMLFYVIFIYFVVRLVIKKIYLILERQYRSTVFFFL